MGRFSSKRDPSRLFLGVAPKAVGFYPTNRDKAGKFAATNIPGVASGDIRDPFGSRVVRYFIPQKTDKTRSVCGDDANRSAPGHHSKAAKLGRTRPTSQDEAIRCRLLGFSCPNQDSIGVSAK